MAHNHIVRPMLLHRSVLSDHIDGLIARTSASVYWKDKSCHYLDANDNFLMVSGHTKQCDVINTTDADMHWHAYASYMMENDREVIHRECVNTYIEPSVTLEGRAIHYLSHKTPLRNKMGKVIGVFGLSFLLDDECGDVQANSEWTVLLGTHVTEKVRHFVLNRKQKSLGLSDRQLACLQELVQGKTMKQIASSLSLSPRTVEHYIETVKVKLNCFTKADLIMKVMSLFG